MKYPIRPRQLKKRLPRPITILTPHEFQALLTNATPEPLPAIVLGGFCGLRPAEIYSLNWSAIDFANKAVHVEGGLKSHHHRRLVPLPDAAGAWLAPIAQHSGPVINSPSQAAFFAATAPVWTAAGIKRQPNILRLSLISYLLAATNDIHTTASEVGISSTTLETHFLKQISTEDAAAWFGIFPS